jgi:hypothetical protein
MGEFPVIETDLVSGFLDTTRKVEYLIRYSRDASPVRALAMPGATGWRSAQDAIVRKIRQAPAYGWVLSDLALSQRTKALSNGPSWLWLNRAG